MAAHVAGTVRATIGRASDSYGPWGRQSTAGERLFDPALAGKTTRVLGDPGLPHTFTYLGDFARGLVTLGTHDEALGESGTYPAPRRCRPGSSPGLFSKLPGSR
jgi:nucleoside-diphosphate-sugar epimerase